MAGRDRDPLAPYCFAAECADEKADWRGYNDNGNSTKDCGYASVFLVDEMVPKVKNDP
jgi:hypothetical protein